MEKIITVKGYPEIKTAKNGNDYLEITDTAGKKYGIFAHRDKWAIIQDGFNVKLIGEQKGQFFNTEDFELVAPDVTPPGQVPSLAAKPLPEHAPQEIGMWWKEVGEMIRAGKIDKATVEGKALITFYYLKMFDVIGFSIKKKEA